MALTAKPIMTAFNRRIAKFFAGEWPLAALVLVIFLLTNRYIFGWDDQHLEIPLLKHLIDPALYSGDYYVESLKDNFTSFLYPLLSRFLSVDMIPAAYLTLYLTARLILFYWVLRMWKYLSGGSRLAAFFCTLSIFMIGRTEEFIYRTFSHQEFSYIFVFAGLYLFYRGRFLIAALILGVGANFHALYSLFPMLYLSLYLLLFKKEKKWALLFKTGSGFVLAALPFIIWTLLRAVKTRLHADPQVYSNWMELYLLSCPQNFLFGTTPIQEVWANKQLWLTGLHNYIFMLVLYAVHLTINEDLRKDLKTHALAIVVTLLTCTTYFFTYVVPSHFILDLNLVRNEQFIRYMLSGYTVLLLWRNLDGPWWRTVLLTILLALSGGKELSDAASVAVLGLIFLSVDIVKGNTPRLNGLRWLLAAVFSCVLLFYREAAAAAWAQQTEIFRSAFQIDFPTTLKTLFGSPKFAKGYWLGLGLSLLSGLWFIGRNNTQIRKKLAVVFLVLPFSIAFVFYCILHYNFVHISMHGGGFWQLQRNWEDMQFYVREHTPKDALIMTPNDMEMGGFRIHSNRKVLVDYRDCGIVGFDLKSTVEWQRRMKDIEAFKVIIKEPFTSALLNGIVKYKVDYIVFMRYAAPSSNVVLSRMYENEAFVLFKVNRGN